MAHFAKFEIFTVRYVFFEALFYKKVQQNSLFVHKGMAS